MNYFFGLLLESWRGMLQFTRRCPDAAAFRLVASSTLG